MNNANVVTRLLSMAAHALHYNIHIEYLYAVTINFFHKIIL